MLEIREVVGGVDSRARPMLVGVARQVLEEGEPLQ